MNKYLELTKKHQKEVNEFPIVYCFGDSEEKRKELMERAIAMAPASEEE